LAGGREAVSASHITALRFLLFYLLFAICSTHAAVPVLDSLYPAGGQAGTTLTVTTSGKLDPWPVKVWTDTPGLIFTPEKAANTFTVKIAGDLAPGVHQVRFYNDDGASSVRAFLVGTVPEIAEKEPNDSFKQAQVIEKLPVIINGRLDKSGDVDSYAVKLEAGKWLVAAVDGYGLGSPIDPFLHLLDADGHRLAFANDTANFDPLLAWKVAKSGTYILQIAAFVHPPAADIRFAGSASSVYRLTITEGPYVGHTFPSGARRVQKTVVQLIGWNLPAETAELDLTAETTADHFDYRAPGAGKPVQLPLGGDPEVTEKEPNNKPAEAQKVTPPCVVNGRIQPAGDVDRFSFAAKKDERFEFRVRSIELGFLLDTVLAVEDSTGSRLARNEMRGESITDPKLSWTAPSDGTFIVSVADLEHRGGPDYVYRLEISHPEPDYTATIDNQSYRLEVGKTVEMKLNLNRLNGYKGKLAADIKGLPAGVSVKGDDLADKGGEVKLVLTAAEDAAPFSGPIQVVIVPAPGKDGKSRIASFVLKDKDAPGDLLLNETTNAWLTVNAMLVPEEKKKKKK